MFQLPIEYRKHHAVAESMVADLELVATHEPKGRAMNDVLFEPRTEMAAAAARRTAQFFTTDSAFLKETVRLIKENSWELFPEAEAYLAHWKRFQNTPDFKTLYHFVEHDRLAWLNQYPKVLLVLGVQSVASPLLFLASPLLILIIPFVLMRLANTEVGWAAYQEALMSVLKRHALTSAFFGPRTVGNMFSSGVSLILFLVQLYTNVQSCWQFYRNLARTHETLERTRDFLGHALSQMDAVERTAKGSSYGAFKAAGRGHSAVLRPFWKELEKVRDMRAFSFSEVRQLGFVGWTECMANVKELLAAKVVAPCVFSKKGGVRFNRVYYPPCKSNERHSYGLSPRRAGKLITGPNASGKTTFIKSAMLGVLFSQQLGCGFYQKATLRPYEQLCCYLNIPDTSGRDSLFQAEARRCKEILSLKGRMFCIFDELFSGTNPYEACASAYGFLTHMAADASRPS